MIGASSFCAMGFAIRKVSSCAGEKITFFPYMVLTCTEPLFPVLTFQTFSVILKSILFSSEYVHNNYRRGDVLGKCMPDC